jgi:hypothetical protein
MLNRLYLLKDRSLFGGSAGKPFGFGISPVGRTCIADYEKLDRRICLKDDLGWHEVGDLQELFAKSSIWENFPAGGLKFIAAEVKGGTEDQRIDLVYLRDDGGIYPCELKIGGNSKDTHGQLIRYIADLHSAQICRDWLVNLRKGYLERIGQCDWKILADAEQDLDRFISRNKICDDNIRLIHSAGIAVDESFKLQLLRAVRYLNEVSGFSIRLLEIQTFVASDWDKDADRYLARIDIVEIH